PGLVALLVAQPADSRRKSLERDLLAGPAEPLLQAMVVGEQLEQFAIGGGDVRRISRERDPAERAASLAERVANERRHEAGVRPGRAVESADLRLCAQVVAVVERDRAAALHLDDR